MGGVSGVYPTNTPQFLPFGWEKCMNMRLPYSKQDEYLYEIRDRIIWIDRYSCLYILTYSIPLIQMVCSGFWVASSMSKSSGILRCH